MYILQYHSQQFFSLFGLHTCKLSKFYKRFYLMPAVLSKSLHLLVLKLNSFWPLFTYIRSLAFKTAATAAIITHATFTSANFVLRFDSSNHSELSQARVILLTSGLSSVFFLHIFSGSSNTCVSAC